MKDRDDIFLSLDIGTNYIKSLISRRGKDNTLEVLGCAKVKQSSGAMSAGAIMNIPAVTDSCESAISLAEKSAATKVKNVVVGISGELVKSKTSTIHYRRSDPEKPLSDSEMSRILEKVQTSTKNSAQSEIAFEMDNPLAEASLLSSCIISVNIDGQQINNPIGFRGSEMIIEFYTVFAPKIHISAIEKICSDLELNLLAIASDPFAICRAYLGCGDSTNTPLTIIDIGGENTSLAMIDARGIRGTTTFSMGVRDLNKNLSVWLSGVAIAFEEFSSVDIFPNRIYLCGGGSNLIEVQESLATENWYTDLPFSRRPTVNLLEISSLPGLKKLQVPSLDESFIVSLGLARIAFDAKDTQSTKNTLKSKFHKLLEK